ncbi:uracil-DNA glycosylase, family 4 [Prauserella sp. Am3]|nr:uracil-DNA glycosylase, family 4 [Prauserella sp. Am3]
MADRTVSAADFVPDTRELRALSRAVRDCRGCGLYENATQAVFGSGPAQARVMVVGEQPGDREDTEGEPFVGPAGRLLDKAFADSGFDREDLYLTNAVKHFKFVPPERGKRRIHQKPSRGEVVACRPWLTAELETVRPELVVLLGATAAQAVFGTSFRITQQRGEVLHLPEELADPDTRAVATVHPSSVLRSRDRDADYDALVVDLRSAADAL